jgi:hypothetical protein
MFNIWIYLVFAYHHKWKIVGEQTFAPSVLPTQFWTHMEDCGQADFCSFIVANSILHTHGRLWASRLLQLHCCQINSAHTWKIVGKQTFAPSMLPTQFCTTKDTSSLNWI